MALDYEVRPNYFKEGTWYPRPVQKKRIPHKRLLEDVVTDTLITAADARAVVSAYARRIAYYLSHGYPVGIEGLVDFSISLSEELPDEEAVVSEAVKVRVNTRTDAELAKESSKNLELNKVRVSGRRPELDSLRDVRTGGKNVYTPGSIVKIKGANLKLDAEATDEGVFFVAVETGKAIRADTYSRLGSNLIDCQVPADVLGQQYIEVHTRLGTKEMRTARLRSVVQPVV